MKNVAFYAVMFSILMVGGMWNYACYGKNAYPVEPDYPPLDTIRDASSDHD